MWLLVLLSLTFCHRLRYFARLPFDWLVTLDTLTHGVINIHFSPSHKRQDTADPANNIPIHFSFPTAQCPLQTMARVNNRPGSAQTSHLADTSSDLIFNCPITCFLLRAGPRPVSRTLSRFLRPPVTKDHFHCLASGLAADGRCLGRSSVGRSDLSRVSVQKRNPTSPSLDKTQLESPSPAFNIRSLRGVDKNSPGCTCWQFFSNINLV